MSPVAATWDSGMKRVAIGLAAFAVALLLSLAGCSSSRPAGSPAKLRVLTWNIHHGEGLDRRVDIDRIAKIIQMEKPDLVALQEIDRGVRRSGNSDIITTLADLTDMTYAFGKTIEFQGGDYGNGILTRYPILEEHNIPYRMIRPGEQRGLMLLVLDVKGEEIVFANTHLESASDDTARLESVGELVTSLKGFSPRPVILCGDLNDRPESRVVSRLTDEGTDAWRATGRGDGFTFPASAPRQRIDYVFVLGNSRSDSAAPAVRLQPSLARVLQSDASDHLPLLVEIELRTER